ncbi:DUF433 domain-containing protein [Paenibacillus sp. NEAU-GSW1]|uniref:DUF433 domain-containing protein n=1 Tax=Paenibacillus sp. NEAU-GSW1 TaxID=2682486 RepID=UPI0012E1275D|nr:DUF433 domain-containing protein [Paenibacillus sp. NEAU-GSW1]MUT64918.1 DUF433 domain-containing protein [Paenibacillus sp. NEAU-GSW1]
MEAVYLNDRINRLICNSNDMVSGRWFTDKGQFKRPCDSKPNEYELFVRNVQNGGLKQLRFEYNGYHQEWKQVGSIMNPSEYFEKVAYNHPSVSMNKQVIGGMPAVAGSRISVSLIVSCLRDGMRISEISEDYGIEEEKIRSSINFVIDILDIPFHED